MLAQSSFLPYSGDAVWHSAACIRTKHACFQEFEFPVRGREAVIMGSENAGKIFVEIGLSEGKAAETAKNPKLSATLMEFIDDTKKELDGKPLEKSQGLLLYQMATRMKAQSRPRAGRLIKAIASQDVKTEVQLSAALEFLLHHVGREFSDKDFRDASGIGIVVSPDQIEEGVKAAISKFKSDLVAERYSFSTGKIMGDVKKSLKWADPTTVKKEIDLQILMLLGPKTADELAGKVKPPQGTAKAPAGKGKGAAKKSDAAKNAGGAADAAAPATDDGAETIEELMKKKVHFHNVGENYKTEGYVVTPHTMELLKAHVKAIRGKVVTRFPPEPNGILHIGHAKAININFGYAKAHDGVCYLRYDDTNPEKEEEKFFKAIKESVEWLGYKPYKITHSSDYFDELYKFAVVLIKEGLAYVCHQTADEMRGFDPKPSPWRERLIQESLQLFEDMKRGKFDEGEATLRMKLKLEEGKLDPVAYRIKFIAHHRTGDKCLTDQWGKEINLQFFVPVAFAMVSNHSGFRCIYPTYDFTHCLCDSLENITHSLCTKEFQSRRSSYYWLCNSVKTYCPVQWEYGRLNMNYTVISKRKIQKLITEKIVSDWDDPRLFTLTALRRRGVPTEAINNFVAKMGLTMALTSVDPVMLDAVIRDVLNKTAPRVMAVLEPLKVTVVNWGEHSWPHDVEAPNFPAEPERGSRRVPFASTFFIERTDFKESAEKGFKRLTCSQSVGLKYVSAVLEVVEVKKGAGGQPSELRARLSPLTGENKPKGFIHWLANTLPCEVRLYDRLFRHKNPEDTTQVPGGFVSDCDPNSLVIVGNALVEAGLGSAKVYDKFQFERIGYFAVDKDSKGGKGGKLVFNRTVLLKEDAGKRD